MKNVAKCQKKYAFCNFGNLLFPEIFFLLGKFCNGFFPSKIHQKNAKKNAGINKNVLRKKIKKSAPPCQQRRHASLLVQVLQWSAMRCSHPRDVASRLNPGGDQSLTEINVLTKTMDWAAGFQPNFTQSWPFLVPSKAENMLPSTVVKKKEIVKIVKKIGKS